MSKRSCMAIFSLFLCAAPIGRAQETVTVGQVGNVVPAGTLLGCILDEPEFSSRTARPGDPLLCKTSTAVEMFGRSLIPRGAYLSARLKNYRDPGHFVGKGWLQFEFTKLTLPGGSVPLDAKVISAARYRVNGDGKVQGRGHAKRDAVEWAIPILWPMKVLTLPATGPRPTLKGETRIELRLMEDLLIPEGSYSSASVLTPRSSALQPGNYDRENSVAGPRLASFRSENLHPPAQQSAKSTERAQVAQPRPTILVLRNGRMYLVDDYWVNSGKLDYASGGAVHAVSIDALDMPLTRQLNAERGVPFIVPVKYQ